MFYRDQFAQFHLNDRRLSQEILSKTLWHIWNHLFYILWTFLLDFRPARMCSCGISIRCYCGIYSNI